MGTQGFRSPECSQLVIASHSDIIAPQLTPKTDIWSFGVLIMRLFLGEDGPASQRQVRGWEPGEGVEGDMGDSDCSDREEMGGVF